jgi:hypothetical protein
MSINSLNSHFKRVETKPSNKLIKNQYQPIEYTRAARHATAGQRNFSKKNNFVMARDPFIGHSRVAT